MVFFWLCLRQFRALARAVPPGPRLSGEGAKGAAKNTVEQSMRTIPDKIVFDLPNATRRFWSALGANTRRRSSRGVPSVRAPYTPGILRPLVLPDCWKGVPRCWRGKLGLVGRGECSSLEHQEAGSWRSNNPHPPQQLTSPLPRLVLGEWGAKARGEVKLLRGGFDLGVPFREVGEPRLRFFSEPSLGAKASQTLFMCTPNLRGGGSRAAGTAFSKLASACTLRPCCRFAPQARRSLASRRW